MTPNPAPSDPVGADTLEQLSGAERYNRWMFDRLRRWVGRRVLEIGSGIGNLSAFLVGSERLVLTDTQEEYLGRLRQRFAGYPNIAVERLYWPDSASTPSSASMSSNTSRTTADRWSRSAACWPPRVGSSCSSPRFRRCTVRWTGPWVITGATRAPAWRPCSNRPGSAWRISSTSISPACRDGGSPDACSSAR